MAVSRPSRVTRVLGARRRSTIAVSVLVAVMAIVLVLDRAFPPPIAAARAFAGSTVLAADGTPLRAFPGEAGTWRSSIAPDGVSPLYLEALTAYEDRWFHHHPGVNPFALVRAAWQALRHGRVVSGGSTLTMQVARLLEPRPRTMGAKLVEMARALQLEARLDKDEILALYLDLAPFGGPLQGVEAASRAYLGKSARDLSHAEAALLAVLPQAPSRLRPDRYPERARAARDKVLDRLARFGVWSERTVEEAREESVAVFWEPRPMSAPLLARRLRSPEGGTVRTTVDARLQARIEARVRAEAGRLPPGTSAAVLVVDNADAAVRVYVGSLDFADDARFGHVDMVSAVRSPGSTLKPFLYGLAIDEGLVHSESLLADAPLSLDGYRPVNFDGRFHGPVSVSEALQRSLNVPAVDLVERLDAGWFTTRLRAAGLALQLPAGAAPSPAVILGGAGVRLEDLVGTYLALGRGGLTARPRLTPESPLVERRLLSPGAAWVVRRILEDAPRPPGPEHASRIPVAWKTGTSYGFRDAWAVGVTAHHTVGVWVGRPDATPSPGQHGASTALPLLMRVVDSLPKALGAPDLAPPPSVRQATVCWPLGIEASLTPPEHCHRERRAWVVDDTVPPTLTEREAPLAWRAGTARVAVDAGSGLRVTAECAPGPVRTAEIARWPLAVTPWLDRATRARSRLPARHPACRDAGAPGGDLRLLGLASGSELRASPTDGGFPTVELHATGATGSLHWMVDGEPLQHGAAAAPFRYTFARPGAHRIAVIDTAGDHDAVEVIVR
ncbi:MAG: penicillin-binding protein 1C [Ectothiorhodospiraceae bacterium]|nr:penicillin-binding protein 1C [Ectothiorhodospiraceae bacterium]